MRASYLTIMPMLAVAILTVVVGERMARREVEERIPVDRDRLASFATHFDGEVELSLIHI